MTLYIPIYSNQVHSSDEREDIYSHVVTLQE